MAPKVVDKEQKRREIAISCKDLIFEVGIRKLTVAQAAKIAGIGKGTIYEYFENKYDIVFEIINISIEEYHQEFLKVIKNTKSTKEKIYYFFKFVLDDSDENMKQFNAYKDYLSIVLSDDNQLMKKYNDTCHIFFKEQLENVINEGIKSNELIPQAKNFIDGLLVFEKGLVLQKMTQENFDVSDVCKRFIDNLFDLIEVRDDK
ncbi:TetR/AcrR family transcriptional regulator [Arcobacter aquimarinus]|uniref:Transcriptional regulator, TetR/AcrR family n=1 Tax=Arcobacter aquimarinus TaxID=1315211 RepID=A0AAE7B3X6_9BACT|nr:TetR/AcrR family transcriptional regulator [Arcobacter aquimarinus]QKE26566.1 transcriptional regulator, TetR/AcrR family [Arcobacter aquimarinus]